MKLVSVVGTRPNFTKEFALAAACQRRGVEEIVVHTGQHYDYDMSRQFFDELSLPNPHYINEIIKGEPGYEIATMLAFIEQVLIREKPDVTLVYGDVNSTVAGAIASVKHRIPVAHVEAGLRTPFLYNPEENNRRLADSVSEYLFPHIREAYESLISEGFPQERVLLAGDIVMDAVLLIMEKNSIETRRGDYNLLTVHRTENADDRERLTRIVEAVLASGESFRFPVHPRTRERLQRFGLYERLVQSSHVELMPPQGFVDFIRLLAGCRKFLTDSGSARREAYVLGKPVITVIDIVWVREMVEIGWEYVADADSDRILDALANHDPDPAGRPAIFGDGHAADQIIDRLVERLG